MRRHAAEKLYTIEMQLKEKSHPSWMVARSRLGLETLAVVVALLFIVMAVLLWSGVVGVASVWVVSCFIMVAVVLLTFALVSALLYRFEFSRECAWRSTLLEWQYLAADYRRLVL
ncbi:hypothetical protein Cs308_0756 [Candidatus Chlamydia sanziniae]|uniref:Uncharacterized protein n=2 Tax=Candidatus Chlamydia sanziniae TaxID=1806891 RepID=A0A1A9HYC5_9CHLA|nr:hypothetical protein Cs308_0756 [Candidatus Chlamydia sanziniae]